MPHAGWSMVARPLTSTGAWRTARNCRGDRGDLGCGDREGADQTPANPEHAGALLTPATPSQKRAQEQTRNTKLEKPPNATPEVPAGLGYVREFGAVLRIADLDEGVRLEIKEVGARKAVSSIWSGTGVLVNSRMLARCLSSSSTVRVDKFFRLRFSWTLYRDCPGRRLRMSRSYREDGRAARSAPTMRPRQ